MTFGQADDLVYEFASYSIDAPGRPVQHWVEVCVSRLLMRSLRVGQAYAAFADCKDVEIMDVPMGACPIQIKVIKRHGNTVQLGEITRWEDRKSPTAAPKFDKGELAYRATYTRTGSSEMRTIFIYAAKDGSNSFLLEASTGERFIGDNKEVSKQFFSIKVEYVFARFIESNAGDGVRPFPLYLR